MFSHSTVLLETLEGRTLFSAVHPAVVSAAVEQDLLAIQTDKTAIAQEKEIGVGQIRTDSAALVLASRSVGPAVREEQVTLRNDVVSDKDKITTDESTSRTNEAAAAAKVQADTAAVKAAAGNVTAEAAAETQLTIDQGAYNNLVAEDKQTVVDDEAALQALIASEPTQLKNTELAAVQNVTTAKQQLLTDESAYESTLSSYDNQLRSDEVKLIADVHGV